MVNLSVTLLTVSNERNFGSFDGDRYFASSSRGREKAQLDMQGYDGTAANHLFGPSYPAVTCLGTAISSVTTGEVPNALLVP